MKIPTLETPRLRLRGWRNEDLDSYAPLVADPEVTKYLGGPVSRADAWRGLAMMLGHWELRGFGLWAVERKSDNAFVGRVGLLQPEGWPGTEVAWTLGREYWGQGYATEAAKAVLNYGFQNCPISRLISMIDAENRASQRVAERLGYTRNGSATFAVFGKSFTADLWEITRERWSSN